MSKTIIYSCGKGTTSRELMANTHADVDVWWPEIEWVDGEPIPLHESEIAERVQEWTGKTVVTVSEIMIVSILREVRVGRLSAGDVEIYCNGRRIDIALDGEWIVDAALATGSLEECLASANRYEHDCLATARNSTGSGGLA